MPEIIETTVYRLDELAEAAKDKAHGWYRNGAISEDWHNFVYDDFEAIAAILGIQMKTQTVRLYGGGTRQEPRIYFSGFWSQGDGACFEARYRYQPGAAKAIRQHAPQDRELHKISETFQAIQQRNFFQITADVTHRGHYYHEYAMDIVVDHESRQSVAAEDDQGIGEALRDLARWLYHQLEREYAYQTSDAAVEEAILANNFTFTQDGRRFG
jgi:hypothetical protein